LGFNMQIIILAGGLGTRLRPLTYRVPKPMTPVLGKPYLHYQLDYLRRQGIEKALMLVGYLGEQIEDYFGNGDFVGMELDYSKEDTLLGTGGALKLAEGKIKDDFILIYGDSFLPLVYSDFESAFRRAGTGGMIAVYADQLSTTGVRKNVSLSPAGMVARYEKGSSSTGLDYVEAGVSAFLKDVVARIPSGRVVSLEEEIYPELVREGQLSGYITGSRFFDIGSERRVKEMEEWLKNDYFKDTVPS
jgi:MurNAc alpha-1-phosphate uridylyltransferase